MTFFSSDKTNFMEELCFILKTELKLLLFGEQWQLISVSFIYMNVFCTNYICIIPSNAIPCNSYFSFCHNPEGPLNSPWQLDTRDTSAHWYQRQWSSHWDRADKLAWPISDSANSCSVADLSPWGQRTTQWMDAWLVLASEQKKRNCSSSGLSPFHQ